MRVRAGAAAALAALLAVGSYVVRESGASTAPECPPIREVANRIVLAGDAAAGAALPLQADGARYRVAMTHAVETELHGFGLVAANRACFSGVERAGVDAQIQHSQNLLRKYQAEGA